MVLEKKDGQLVPKLDDNSKAILFTVSEVDDFFTQVGNTDYYFHPEEILATRFDLMVREGINNPFTKMLRETLVGKFV